MNFNPNYFYMALSASTIAIIALILIIITVVVMYKFYHANGTSADICSGIETTPSCNLPKDNVTFNQTFAKAIKLTEAVKAIRTLTDLKVKLDPNISCKDILTIMKLASTTLYRQRCRRFE